MAKGMDIDGPAALIHLGDLGSWSHPVNENVSATSARKTFLPHSAAARSPSNDTGGFLSDGS